MVGEKCRTCGEILTRDGCPNRIAHAVAIREAGFVPEKRGAPSRPGSQGAEGR